MCMSQLELEDKELQFWRILERLCHKLNFIQSFLSFRFGQVSPRNVPDDLNERGPNHLLGGYEADENDENRVDNRRIQ